MNNNTFDYIIQRLLDNANDAVEEMKVHKGDPFYDGRQLAYYEVLDTIKNELMIHDYDLSRCGLDIDLDNMVGLKS